MVSQPVAHQELDSISISSFIRGYHVYKSMWTPTVGETLQLRQELQNEKDRKAVAIMKEAVVVGHVPYNLAPTISRFLQREINKGTARVTGNYVNRGGGYCLEIPCIYCMHGPKPFISKIV